MPASRRILVGYFTLAGLYTLSAALIWGVNTLFLLNAGLSFFEVFIANAAFSAGMGRGARLPCAGAIGRGDRGAR